MTLFDMVRNGGPGAYAALFFGVLGAIVGLAAIVAMMRSRNRGRVVGVVAIVIAAFTASLGVVGMQMGIRKTDAVLASEPLTEALHERVRVEGFIEAQCAAQVGLFGALATLILGGIAAFAGSVKTRKWGLTIGSSALAAIPVTGAVLACVASPHAKYPFDARQPAPWDLKYARVRIDTDLEGGCDDFDQALDEAHEASLDPETIVVDAHVVATKCARNIFSEIKTAGGEVRRSPSSLRDTMKERRAWNADTLLASPLLVDENLRREVAAYKRTTFL